MKTLKLLMIVMLALVSLSGRGQSPQWEWARGAGGSTDEYLSSMVTDASGNIYAVGYFDSPNLSFGSHTINNYAPGNLDIFVVKFDSSGNTIWAKDFGNEYNEFARSITIDASCNIYLMGDYDSPSLSFGSFVLINAGGAYFNTYIVKMDSSGNVLWAKNAGGNDGNDYGNSITTDNFGNAYAVGDYNSSSITFGSTTLINNGSNCSYIVKYDSSGNVIWAKNGGGTIWDNVISVKANAYGYLYIGGNFRSDSITFGTTTLHNDTTNNTWDIYLVKYDTAGNVIWAKSAGGSVWDVLQSVSIDALDNIIIAGFFNSPTLIFGSTTLTSLGYYDIFMAKYDSSGNVLWAKNYGGTNNNVAFVPVVNDASNNIYLGGYFTSSSIIFGNDTLSNLGGEDFFILKSDVNGNVLWAKSAGNNSVNSYDLSTAITIDAFGNILVMGDFESQTIIFDTTTLFNLGAFNSNDIFLAKISFAFTTNIKEFLLNNNEILLSPNPFTTQTMLTLQGTYHNPSLFIYNLLGQEVRGIPVGTNKQITINREQLPSGMYFYKLIDENKEVLGIGKLLVE